MKKFIILIILLILLPLTTNSAYARSGCCSHHGGVSSEEYGCNDGTSISDTCAPYYSCAANTNYNYQAPVIQSTEIPTAVPTKVALPTSTPLTTASPTPLSVENDVSTVISPAEVNVAGDNASGNRCPDCSV